MTKKVWLEAQARNFTKTPNGVRWEAVIFSSEFNRNRAYFDIKKTFKPFETKKDLLNKILLNDDHNGKYFAVTTDRVTDIVVNESEDGQITEVYGVVESTNPDKTNNPNQVTGFSIEIMVDAENVAVFADGGEYYREVEWSGLAYLKGQMAGSGNTRLLAMRTFAEANNESSTNTGKIKIYNKLTKKFMYLDIGEIVVINATQEPAFVIALAQNETKMIIELEKFDGSTVVLECDPSESAEENGLSYGGTYLMIKYIVKMIRELQSSPTVFSVEEAPKTDTKTTPELPAAPDEPEGIKQINNALNTLDELEAQKRQKQMQIFNLLPNSESLVEDVVPATNDVKKVKEDLTNIDYLYN